MSNWRPGFHNIALAVAVRLEQGERNYQGRTFELPPSSIIAEAQAELLENAAYSFIAYCRPREAAAGTRPRACCTEGGTAVRHDLTSTLTLDEVATTRAGR